MTVRTVRARSARRSPTHPATGRRPVGWTCRPRPRAAGWRTRLIVSRSSGAADEAPCRMPADASSPCIGKPSTTGGISTRRPRPFRPRSSSRSRARSSRGNDSPDISFDRSINPHRGCEHTFLLLRTADPCVPGPLRRPRFRNQDLPRRMPRSSWELRARWLRAEDHRARGQYRSLPAGRTALPNHPFDPGSAQPCEPSGRHRHESASSRATSTSSLRWLTGSSPRWPSRSRPTPSSIARHGARAASPAKRLRHHSQTLRGRHPGHGPRRADHPGHQRARDRGDPEGGLSGREPAEVRIRVLRLPHELKDLMREWLLEHYPSKLARVLRRPAEPRRQGLRPQWRTRQTGVGPFAWMIGRRSETATERPASTDSG